MSMRRHPCGWLKSSRLGAKGSFVIRERGILELYCVSSQALRLLWYVPYCTVLKYDTVQYIPTCCVRQPIKAKSRLSTNGKRSMLYRKPSHRWMRWRTLTLVSAGTFQWAFFASSLHFHVLRALATTENDSFVLSRQCYSFTTSVGRRSSSSS